MSLEMWFVWLLRSDIRGGNPVGSRTAQQEFAIWWMQHGSTEYPHVWHLDQTTVRLAMRPTGSLGLPRFVFSLWLSRPDLRAAYPLANDEDAADILCWYRIIAPVDYRAAVPLPARYEAVTEAPSRRFQSIDEVPLPRLAFGFWRLRPELHHIDLRVPAERARYADWFRAVGRPGLPACRPCVRRPIPLAIIRRRRKRDLAPYGVNLVGFASAEFGLGEDLRRTCQALDRFEIPNVVVTAGTPAGTRGRDDTVQGQITSDLRYETTIFCMSAFDTAELYLKRGPDLFRASHNIGYWPWELPRFPSDWSAVSTLVDEIWAATRYQQEAYRRTCSTPVTLMPLAFDVIPRVTARRATRGFRFIYPFDPRSYLARKNPIAAVRAFRRAFPRNDRGVELILRVNGTAESSAWKVVERAARADPRIRTVSGTLDRPVALQWLQESDCLISPHRAEGFGRNIVEAILLGVPVIATAFSGPDDYLAQAERLKSRQVAIREADYPFAAGQSWSEPSLGELSKLMEAMRASRPNPVRIRRRAKQIFLKYGLEAAGRNYAARLAAIWRAAERGSPRSLFRHGEPD